MIRDLFNRFDTWVMQRYCRHDYDRVRTPHGFMRWLECLKCSHKRDLVIDR